MKMSTPIVYRWEKPNLGVTNCRQPAAAGSSNGDDGANVMTTLIGALLLIVPAVPAQPRFVSAVVHLYGDDDSESRAVFSNPVSLPPNVIMPADYDDLVEGMLRSSPTFRGQCSRIGRATQLHIVVQRSVLAPAQSALTNLVRQSGGRIHAGVEIGMLGDVVMLIAHEFEHIIEQLDGVDLAAMAGRAGTGVRADPRTGQFETERAIAIGQRVAREVSRAVARK
jgi:hypothetical protein